MNTIWCAFSVDNNYDQPNNNLVCWWPTKPSIEEFSNALGYSFPTNDDDTTLAIVKAWSGTPSRIIETDYRLEETKSGIPL